MDIASNLTIDNELRKLLDFFGIDESFPALLNLLTRLCELYENLDNEYISLVEKIPWPSVGKIKNSLEKRGFELRASGNNSNAASGFLEISQLASMILQRVNHGSLKAKYDGLCLAVLLHMEKEPPSVSVANELCSLVRQSAKAEDLRSRVLDDLPDYQGDFSHYADSLKSSIRADGPERKAWKESQKKYLKSLVQLSNLTKYFGKFRTQANSDNISTSNVDSDSRDDEWVTPDTAHTSAVQMEIFSDEGEDGSTQNISKPEAGEDSLFHDEDSKTVTSKTSGKNNYWSKRAPRLVESSSVNLNHLERMHLASYLREGCAQPTLDASLAPLIIALSYMTGMTIREILSRRFSSDEFITKNGTLLRYLPRLPIVYGGGGEPGKRRVELSFPHFVQDWFERFSQEIALADSLVELAPYTESKLILHLDEQFRKLRENGRYRIKQPKVSACLGSITATMTGDPVLVGIFTATLEPEPPVLAFYKAVSVEEVESVYANVLDVMLGADYKTSSEKMSKYALPDGVEDLVSGIKGELHHLLDREKKDILAVHATYMYYTLSLFMFATGHRPIKDPFCYLSEFHEDFFGVLISDKVMDERHAYRYQPIPEIARQQLLNYISHLEVLSEHLINKMHGQCRQLGYQIRAMLQGKVKTLPLFFDISLEGTVTFSVTRESLTSFWQRFTSMPVNSGRAIVATELSNHSFSAKDVELFLGHVSGPFHPWGDTSFRVPRENLERLAKNVDQILRDMKWSVIPPLTNLKGKASKSLPRNIGNYHADKTLGPEERKKRRAEYRYEVRVVTEMSIRIATQDALLDIHQAINSEKTKRLIKIIQQTCESHPDINFEDCVELFQRWLTRKQLQTKLTNRPKNEYSPFHKKSLTYMNERLWFERKIREYLGGSANKNSDISINRRFAELIITASIYGGVSQVKLLKTLPHCVANKTFHLEKSLVLDLDGWWWCPDYRSTCLIISIHRQYETELQHVDMNSITDELETLFVQLSVKTSRAQIFGVLSKYAESYQIECLPGCIRTAYSATVPSKSFSHVTLARIYSKNTYSTSTLDDPEPSSREEQVWLPIIKSVEESADLKLIHKKVSALMKESECIEAKGGDLKKTAVRKRLAERFISFVEQENNLPPVISLLLTWGVKLCWFGNVKEDLTRGSVTRYLDALRRLMLTAFGYRNPLLCQAEDFEYLYFEMLSGSGCTDKKYTVGILYFFHQFMTQHYAVEDPDWSVLYGAAGATPPSQKINANFLTVEEYDQSLQLVMSDKQLSDWNKIRYASAIILGYRFGLRFGEVFRLQLRDIQKPASDCPIVLVRNNIFGNTKTKASVRQIPLVGEFSPLERDIFSTLIAQAEQWGKEDYQIPLMFEGDLRFLIDVSLASRYLNSLLKSLTCDRTVRFHHLRHSCVTRLIALAFVPKSTGHWATIRSSVIGRLGGNNVSRLWGGSGNKEKKVLAISTVIGHRSVLTTFSSYFHLTDFIGADFINNGGLEISISELAYLLGRSRESIYKRRERAEKERGFSCFLKYEKVHKLFSELCQTLTVVQQDKNWDWGYDSQSMSVLNLYELDRVLLLNRRRDGRHRGIASLVGKSEVAIEQVLENASRIELDSGYYFYQAIKSQSEFMLRANLDWATENISENTRIRSLARKLQARIESLSVEELANLKLGLLIWSECFDRNSPDWRFYNLNDLNRFLQTLKTLMIDAEFQVSIPESLMSEHEYEQYSSSGIKFQHYSPAELHKKDVLCPILLRAVNLPTDWKSRATVNRLCMLCLLQLNLLANSE